MTGPAKCAVQIARSQEEYLTRAGAILGDFCPCLMRVVARSALDHAAVKRKLHSRRRGAGRIGSVDITGANGPKARGMGVLANGPAEARAKGRRIYHGDWMVVG